MYAVITHDNRMNRKTKLKESDFIAVQNTNKEAYNQMAYLCEYCGTPIYLDCHYHEFNCIECEQKNFCENCNEIIVYKSKFSDME